MAKQLLTLTGLIICTSIFLALSSILVLAFGLVGKLNFFLTSLGFIFLALVGVSFLWMFKQEIFTTNKSNFHNFLLVILAFTIVSHFVGVVTPEVGFDALWYHLPVIRAYTTSRSILYLSSHYQSLYPQYGDLVLLLGYGLGGMYGVKAVAYSCMLQTLLIIYVWIKRYLNSSLSLLVVTSVALFQVVAWQASSAYVDVISTLFGLTGLLLLFESGISMDDHRKETWIAGLMLGVFIGTKFISLGFLPALFVLSWLLLQFRESSLSQSMITFIQFWTILTLVALPWYLRAYYYTGNLLYPIGTEYADPVIQQMGVAGWGEWISRRVSQLSSLPIQLFLFNREYTSPLLLLMLCLLPFFRYWSVKTIMMLFFSAYSMLFWFFFPPPSVRYVLLGIIILTIFLFIQTERILSKRVIVRKVFHALCAVILVLQLSLRAFVVTRYYLFIVGSENQRQYLDRYRNGFNDEKIDQYYLQ